MPVERERDGQDSQAHHVLVLCLEMAVGTGRCRLFGEVGKMERIAVDAAMRGRGVGRLIMEALEAWALEQGATVARLASQDSALTFYECLGYQAHGEAFMDAGISHRWMDKCLGRG